MSADTAPKLTLPVGDRDHTQGPAVATVTLVEYGDYQCPHCRQVHPIISELRERFGERLRFVFRHFPIKSVHPNAQLAAEAAEAAAAQGKFWEMHEYLFEHQDALDKQSLIQHAAELGLDVERFDQELTEHLYADRVREDFMSGVRSGVNGTPTFYVNGVRYDGAWDLESLAAEIEKPLGVQVRLLFQQFARLQASGGIVLLIATVLALAWANSPWGHYYFELWETNLAITLGSLSLSEHLLEWVNDGLMVVFFFVVGLEIKRELIVGELASARRAALPIMAAIGGMLVPALIYTLLNAGTEAQSGWGIPVATDIAFTLGILTVLGKRVPTSLKVFFTAMAIADDLGAVVVIALFYSKGIHWTALAVGGGILVALIVLNRLGIRRPLPYALLGVGLWLAFLEGGVHPTIAGVLLAMTIPARTPVSTQAFLAQCTAVLGEFEPGISGEAAGHGGRERAAVQTLESIAERIQSPAERLERLLTPWTTYVILPIFALANAGVSLSGNIAEALTSPLSLGIALGLLLGKSAGISLFSWLAVKTGIGAMPVDVQWPQLFSASWLAGIGFTMSLFIAGAAFSGSALSTAKLSILVASILAAAIGSSLLILTSQRRDRVTRADRVAATA